MIGGKYRIERELGEGGMGFVFVATNVVLERPVALKVMSPEMAKQPEWVGRFLREAVAASKTRHPGIVQVFDAGQDPLGPWIAMELLEGESLRTRLTRVGRLSVGDTIHVARAVLDALAAVHDAGIVHRDLKPDNVFLERTPDGGERMKLLDFGIAKQLDSLTSLTTSGVVLGTARYLAPEQARNAKAVDARTDLYAMGTILYECLSGTTPYDAENTADLIAKLLTQAPRDLAALAPHVPPAIVEIVSQCLAHHPDARPRSARELAGQLERALAGVSADALHAVSGEAVERARLIPNTLQVARTEAVAPPKRGWIAAVVVLVLALIAMASAGAIYALGLY